jgi:hypothetical protein
MKLCIEGDIYFIPKFHILETGTVKLSIETGLKDPRESPENERQDGWLDSKQKQWGKSETMLVVGSVTGLP